MTWIDPDIARTKALRQGFKDEVVPYLKALGFKKQYPPLAAGTCIDLWGNNWSRQRGDFMDEVHIEWRTLQRPYFMIEFWTDQTERMTLYDQRQFDGPGGSFYAWLPATPPRKSWIFNLYAIPQVWYGETTPLDKTLALAKERLANLDEYLRTGHTDAHIDLPARVAVWRERPAHVFRDLPPAKKRRDTWLDRLVTVLFISKENYRRATGGAERPPLFKQKRSASR